MWYTLHMENSEKDQLLDFTEFFEEDCQSDASLEEVEDFAHQFIAQGSARLNGVLYQGEAPATLPLTVRENLARVQAKYADRFDISTENVLAEYAKAAFFDPRDLFDATGKLRPVHELDNQVSAAIAGLKVTQVGGSTDGWVEDITYKFLDKLKALDSLSRNLGLFQDNIKLEHSGEISSDVSDNEKTRRIAFLLEELMRAKLKNSGNPG